VIGIDGKEAKMFEGMWECLAEPIFIVFGQVKIPVPGERPETMVMTNPPMPFKQFRDSRAKNSWTRRLANQTHLRQARFLRFHAPCLSAIRMTMAVTRPTISASMG